MNDIDKKKYTKHTILTGNKERITEVLKRYWFLRNPAKNEKPIEDIAQEIFE